MERFDFMAIISRDTLMICYLNLFNIYIYVYIHIYNNTYIYVFKTSYHLGVCLVPSFGTTQSMILMEGTFGRCRRGVRSPGSPVSTKLAPCPMEELP